MNGDCPGACSRIALAPRYLGYILRAAEPRVLSQVETAARGTKRLRTETLEGVQMPMPMPVEQRRIVNYLVARSAANRWCCAQLAGAGHTRANSSGGAPTIRGAEVCGRLPRGLTASREVRLDEPVGETL